MLDDDIFNLLKFKHPMTSGELAKELKQPESVVLTALTEELSPKLVERGSDGKWKRKPEPIPPVDTDVLKTVWHIRSQLGRNGAVDILIYERACKPGADVMSAAHRMGVFMLMIQMLPKEFDGLLHDGQPNDALFDFIAHVPLAYGATMSFPDLRELRERTAPMQ